MGPPPLSSCVFQKTAQDGAFDEGNKPTHFPLSVPKREGGEDHAECTGPLYHFLQLCLPKCIPNQWFSPHGPWASESIFETKNILAQHVLLSQMPFKELFILILCFEWFLA